MAVTLKVVYENVMHRSSVSMEELSLNSLHAHFLTHFEMPLSYVLEYVDNENDVITITSIRDFEEACHVFLECYGNASTLIFHARNVSAYPCVILESGLEMATECSKKFMKECDVLQTVKSVSMEVQDRLKNFVYTESVDMEEYVDVTKVYEQDEEEVFLATPVEEDISLCCVEEREWEMQYETILDFMTTFVTYEDCATLLEAQEGDVMTVLNTLLDL